MARRPAETSVSFQRRLHRVYGGYALGLVAFFGGMALLERMGLPKAWIGFTFLIATVGLYAGIGIMGRTTDPDEYYVAGRRVPAFYNGMATAADWMSAATFLGLAGSLYLSGYGGLAYLLGWTGGFCLVAFLIAPYLRRFGKFTVPDFIGDRYGGTLPRLVALLAAIVCSFTYVVAQIYGMGLVTARLTGVDFTVGIFLGIGAILVCSFLGGMRAVTWTQVAQYVILLVAYLLPAAWLSVKHSGLPVPQLSVGAQVQRLGERERELLADPGEREVVLAFQARADTLAKKLRELPGSLAAERQAAQATLFALKQSRAPLAQVQAAEKRLAAVPRDEATARAQWSAERAASEARARPLAGMAPHAQAYAGDPQGSPAERAAFDDARLNFLALVAVLMLGTASLPHVLMRYYTTPSVREARESVTWTLLFVLLLYLTAPALAVLLKLEIFDGLVGLPFEQLPTWIRQWSRVDAGSLLSVADVNGDGRLQLAELRFNPDILVLAAPEIGGLPYVVSGLVAAGGLAAALSTADGLLLTISNALSHDLYFKILDPKASTATRVTISKALLLVVALAAAAVAASKPADILFLVSAAFSLAAGTFFPPLVLGVFWRRANRYGASLGMLAGLGVTAWYMATTQPWLRGVFGVTRPVELWWGVQPLAAGVFGVALGFAVMVLVSLVTPRPDAASEALVGRLRSPGVPSPSGGDRAPL